MPDAAGASMTGNGAGLVGLRVLVAEDNVVIGLDLAEMLRDFGCTVLGPVATLAELAVLLQRERPDIALLDLELADGPVSSILPELRALGIPFVLVTGHGPESLHDPVLDGTPRLSKPYGLNELRRLLAELIGGQGRIGGPDERKAAGVS